MTRLLKRVARVTIGDRKFEYPGLDIEIEQRQVFGSFAQSTITLWNPNDTTVGKCQSITEPSGDPKVPDIIIRPDITVEAGYGDSVDAGKTEVVSFGEIKAFKLDQPAADRALIIEVSDKGKFRTSAKNYSLKQPNTASVIMRFISSGFSTPIRVGEEAYLDRYVIRDELDSIRQLTKQTKSVFYFRGGILNVIPASLTPRKPTVIDRNSGLLGRPTKIETGKENERGYKVTTLFIPGVGVGSSLRFEIKAEKRWVTGVIYETALSFSTVGANKCEHKVAA